MNNDAKPAIFLKIIIFLLVILALMGLKILYHQGEVELFQWLLLPVAIIVTSIKGIPFQFFSHIGYVNYEEMIVINKSCSGLNFFIISFSLALFTCFPYQKRPIAYFKYLIVFILSAYFLTIMANINRICWAIDTVHLGTHYQYLIGKESWTHEGQGIIVFFSYLLVYYFILLYFKRKKQWITLI
ncbi:MAG: exosortase K [Spirochaetes bacterium]|nr:exosortase K [Spirochaetota bacterium]